MSTEQLNQICVTQDDRENMYVPLLPVNRQETTAMQGNEVAGPHWFTMQQQIRAEVRNKLEGGDGSLWELPELTPDTSLFDLTKIAEERIDAYWNQSGVWNRVIEVFPELQDNPLVYNANGELNQEFLKGFLSNQFSVLDSLRQDPARAKEFYFLNSLASERQLEKLTLSRRWVNEAIRNDKAPGGLDGVSLEAASFLLDFSACFGKYTDAIYLKQLELMDRGADRQPITTFEQIAETGKYAYTSAETGEPLAMQDAFPDELNRLQQMVTGIISRYEKQFTDNPDNTFSIEQMRALHRYCDTLFEHFKNPNADRKDFSNALNELLKSGCRLMPIPPMEAYHAQEGKAPKNDFEFRICMAKQASEEAGGDDPLSGFKENFIAQANSINGKESIVGLYPVDTPFSFGPNLPWATTAQSVEGMVIVDTAVSDKANKAAVERARAYQITGFELNDSLLEQLCEIDTQGHEIGHQLHFESTDADADGIAGDEVKAELASAVLFNKLLESKTGITPEDKKNILAHYLIAKITAAQGYLLTKQDNPPYRDAGIALFNILESVGAVSVSEDGIITLDTTKAEDAVRELTNKGEELLERYKDLLRAREGETEGNTAKAALDALASTYNTLLAGGDPYLLQKFQPKTN